MYNPNDWPPPYFVYSAVVTLLGTLSIMAWVMTRPDANEDGAQPITYDIEYTGIKTGEFSVWRGGLRQPPTPGQMVEYRKVFSAKGQRLALVKVTTRTTREVVAEPPESYP